MTEQIGQQFGNYQLTQLLGEGGFAQVYLGEHIYLGTQAAIKLLSMQLNDDNREGFLIEARTLARLIHPNIVRVLDFGVKEKIPFLVLDYAPNGTLRQRHPYGTRVPLPTIVTYVKQVAEALQYAHDQKLIHRDVKPENMLLGRLNEVLLSDFGLALMAQSTRFQSLQDVEVGGTLVYIAPEQIQGKPRPASDQYSLGIVVYEWLSGERPFRGTLNEIISQQLGSLPPPLREKIPTISPAVEQVVMTALEKEPRKRFGSVREFALTLEQASQSATLLSDQAPTLAASQENEAFLLTEAAPLPSQKSGVPSYLEASVTSPAAAAGTILCRYRGHSSPVSSLSWSPDGTQIVSTGGDKTVHVWEATTGRSIRIYQDIADVVRGVAWSPGGMRIATVGADAIVRVWDVATNRLIVAYQGHAGSLINTLVWSPKQQFLASASSDGAIHVWNATTGQTITIYRGHAGNVYAVAWSPDGKSLVSGGDDATVQVWYAFTGSTASIYRDQTAKALSTAWTPETSSDVPLGSRVACGREDGLIQMWDVITNSQVLAYRYTASVSNLAWSPDGRQFAFASADKIIQVWNTLTNRRQFVFQQAAQVRVMAWSPDGKYIASGGDDAIVQVWVTR
jgi:serine/threonine protein kinase